MAGQPQIEQLLEFTGEVQNHTSQFLPVKNQLKNLVNADTETLGVIKKRKGTSKVGDTLTSSTSTSTSTTTSSSTSTTTS